MFSFASSSLFSRSKNNPLKSEAPDFPLTSPPVSPAFNVTRNPRKFTEANEAALHFNEMKQATENAEKGLPPVYTGTVKEPSTQANAKAFYEASRRAAIESNLPGSHYTPREVARIFAGQSVYGGAKTRKRKARRAKKSRKNKHTSRRR
jgi:hypothetical protein